MRLRAALPLACAALLWSGCHPRTPPPDLSLDAARLLAQVREAQAPLRTVQGETRVRFRTPQGSGQLKQFAAAERPDRLHLEELDFFGNPAAVLVTSGGRFWLYDARQKVLYRGAASAANLSRLVPVPLAPTELVALLLGGAPLDGAPEAAAPDGGSVRLRLREGDREQELWIGTHAVVERIESRVAGGAGPGSWEAELSMHAQRAGAWFPGSLTLRSAPAHVELGLTWLDPEVNGALDARLFEPPAPRGARVVDLDAGE